MPYLCTPLAFASALAAVVSRAITAGTAKGGLCKRVAGGAGASGALERESAPDACGVGPTCTWAAAPAVRAVRGKGRGVSAPVPGAASFVASAKTCPSALCLSVAAAVDACAGFIDAAALTWIVRGRLLSRGGRVAPRP